MNRSWLIGVTLAIVVLAQLTGCGRVAEPGTPPPGYGKVCLEGVNYWSYSRGYGDALSPVYNTDGSIQTCEVAQ